MKELSIEEKAKAYDEALKVLHKYDGAHIMFTQDLKEEMFPELKESEDERIRKALYLFVEAYGTHSQYATQEDMLAWFEKQGEQKPDKSPKVYNFHGIEFIPKFVSGDLIREKKSGTRLAIESFSYDTGLYTYKGGQFPITIQNDYELFEQKPIDKVEPKFKVGDFIVNDYCMGKVIELTNDAYLLDTGQGIPFSCEHNAHLWTIQDAKDGDVLATLDDILIFEKILPKDGGVSYCHYDFGCSTPQFNFNKDENWYFGKEAKVYPATKEQRDILIKAMTDAGYTFDFEKKELKKIKQKPIWSEEDKDFMYDTLNNLTELKDRYGEGYGNVGKCIEWLKSLKERYTWKPSDEQMEYLLTIKTLSPSPLLESLYIDLKKLREE